eukprot:TRINITY_DN7850_c0_g2_i4.p1 TRINITY_DN7850_c0_g2~~TRINITY_DN7850_c0_g2_i4.p1  ORF type:complete len:467 (+),score=85.96 TRINITY_DN7850_c0_g2_i4:71-1471(+)
MIAVLIVAIAAILVAVFVYAGFTERATGIPGPMWMLPVLGETLGFLTRRHSWLKQGFQKYGDVFLSRMLGRPMVCIADPAFVEYALKTENHIISGWWTPGVHQLFPDSFILQRGEAHSRVKKVLLQAFRERDIAAYMSTFEQCTREAVEQWCTKSHVEIVHEIDALAMRNLCQTVLGISDYSEFALRWTALAAAFMAMPINLPFTTFGKGLKAAAAIRRMLRPMLAERHQMSDDELAVRKDTMSLLVQYQRLNIEPTITDEQIISNALVIFFAGIDTLRSTLSLLFARLVQHPIVLQKVVAEQEALRPDPLAPLSPALMRQMDYLGAVVKESARYLPTTSGVWREVLQDFQYKSYRIRKGTILLPSFYGIGHRHYGDPETFEPERMLSPRSEDLLPGHECTSHFGAPSARLCLGFGYATMQIKAVLAVVTREYQFEALAGEDPASYVYISFPQPKSGLRVKFTKRS